MSTGIRMIDIGENIKTNDELWDKIGSSLLGKLCIRVKDRISEEISVPVWYKTWNCVWGRIKDEDWDRP